MMRLGARLAACVALSAILWGCAAPPNPMTFDYAVKVQQNGLRRIRAFFEDNPADPTEISVCYLDLEAGVFWGRYWNVPESRGDSDMALFRELIEALRDQSKPIREEIPVYQATASQALGAIIVSGRNSAIEIIIEENGAHVGDLTGLFVNKPFFRALEQFMVRQKIIENDEYYWWRVAALRKAGGELSLWAPNHGIDSAEALEKAIKKWPPGSLDNPPDEPAPLFPATKPEPQDAPNP